MITYNVKRECWDSIFRSIYVIWTFPCLNHNPSLLLENDIIEQIELVRT